MKNQILAKGEKLNRWLDLPTQKEMHLQLKQRKNNKQLLNLLDSAIFIREQLR